MKTLLYGLGALVILVIAYNFFNKDEKNILDMPPKDADLQLQPEQKFPMQITETPRVDNADQPWYGGSRYYVGGSDSTFEPLESDTVTSYGSNDFWAKLQTQYAN